MRRVLGGTAYNLLTDDGLALQKLTAPSVGGAP
jgi:hypothetical protein